MNIKIDEKAEPLVIRAAVRMLEDSNIAAWGFYRRETIGAELRSYASHHNQGEAGSFKVIRRPLLVSGMLTAEGDILIDGESSPDEQRVTLWHEALHKAGLTDEQQVEEVARKLAAFSEAPTQSTASELAAEVQGDEAQWLKDFQYRYGEAPSLSWPRYLTDEWQTRRETWMECRRQQSKAQSSQPQLDEPVRGVPEAVCFRWRDTKSSNNAWQSWMAMDSGWHEVIKLKAEEHPGIEFQYAYVAPTPSASELHRVKALKGDAALLDWLETHKNNLTYGINEKGRFIGWECGRCTYDQATVRGAIRAASELERKALAGDAP